MTERTCDHIWYASRVEVESAPVHHVCYREIHHDDEHRCACDARQERL